MTEPDPAENVPEEPLGYNPLEGRYRGRVQMLIDRAFGRFGNDVSQIHSYLRDRLGRAISDMASDTEDLQISNRALQSALEQALELLLLSRVPMTSTQKRVIEEALETIPCFARPDD